MDMGLALSPTFDGKKFTQGKLDGWWWKGIDL
jgi:hypothetical protein